MTNTKSEIHVCDDWITVEIVDLGKVHDLSNKLRQAGQWTEVVSGLESISVQFDPAEISPAKALAQLEKQLSSLSAVEQNTQPPVEIPICYASDFAPDREMVAEKLGVTPDEIAAWHSEMQFTVTILGFMPGFAYLQSDAAIPQICRLSHPRQKVDAGSIGLIGMQNCIYSFDSPGGWPIIGRTPSRLFDPTNDPPALLAAGQKLRFNPISRTEFAKLA